MILQQTVKAGGPAATSVTPLTMIPANKVRIVEKVSLYRKDSSGAIGMTGAGGQFIGQNSQATDGSIKREKVKLKTQQISPRHGGSQNSYMGNKTPNSGMRREKNDVLRDFIHDNYNIMTEKVVTILKSKK